MPDGAAANAITLALTEVFKSWRSKSFAQIRFIEGAGDGPRRIDPHGLHLGTSSIVRGAASILGRRRLSHAMLDASAARDCRMVGQPSRPAGGEMALQLSGQRGQFALRSKGLERDEEKWQPVFRPHPAPNRDLAMNGNRMIEARY
jgi:hypothetical protein